MYLNQNIEKLKIKFPYIKWNMMQEFNNTTDNQAEIETSQRGVDTLKVCVDGTISYLHSKYDPVSEARRIVDSLNIESEDQHLLFYGIGLGYVLDIIKERMPKITYSIYEPNAIVFYKFLCSRKLSHKFIDSLSSIYISGLMANEELELLAFFKGLDYNIKPIALPIYERIYVKDFNEFSHSLKDSIIDKRFKVGTKYIFEKIWLRNTMKNFPYTIKSENILDLSEKIFRGKPAILVASGPSLDEEIENLRKIKKDGLAYIFSAGSAVYKLLKHDIFPDAVCAIDGSTANYDIYRVLFENPENKTPIIYADMMYHKVVSSYNAKRFNVIMENDSLAPYYLKFKSDKALKRVKVAPSVALITLQILHNLQCDPIVLVGQNLALKNDYYYAPGIDFHKNRQAKEKITDDERLGAFQVEDVNGNMVYTLKDLDVMRRDMEVLIKYYSINNIINTTSGGAKISGTKYMPLSNLMKERLNKSVVDPQWYEYESEGYDLEYVIDQHKLILKEHEAISDAIEEIEKEIEKIEKAVLKNNENKLSALLFDFSKKIKKLTRNKFYEVFVYPMNTLRIELLALSLKKTAREENIFKKGKEALKGYKQFIAEVKSIIIEIELQFQEFSEIILSYENQESPEK